MAQEIIASRVLVCKRGTEPEFEVTVSLSKPFHQVESDHWDTVCAFESAHLNQQMTVSGQDSMQSLLLAIKCLEATLRRFRRDGYAMYWFNEPFSPLSEMVIRGS